VWLHEHVELILTLILTHLSLTKGWFFHSRLIALSSPFLILMAAEQKAARVEVNISLVFLYWVGIALHP